LSVDIAAEIGHLKADERKLKQALLNLVGNAVKFTPAGGSIAIKAQLLADGTISIAVSDSGIGMKSSDIPKAMTPFMQVDSGPGRRHEGFGLGLPLAKALIELHQGRLDISSIPDEGTVITILLPPERHVPVAAAEQTRAGAGQR